MARGWPRAMCLPTDAAHSLFLIAFRRLQMRTIGIWIIATRCPYIHEVTKPRRHVDVRVPRNVIKNSDAWLNNGCPKC